MYWAASFHEQGRENQKYNVQPVIIKEINSKFGLILKIGSYWLQYYSYYIYSYPENFPFIGILMQGNVW
jgi:hypothetical protein